MSFNVKRQNKRHLKSQTALMPVLKVKSGATGYLNRRFFMEYQEWCRGSFQVFVGDNKFPLDRTETNGPTGF